MHNRLIVSLMVPALLLPTVGCYRTVPIDRPTPLAKTRVEVRLTDRGSLDLGPRIGNTIERVEGSVVESSDSTISLALTSATDRRGITTSWAGEVVDFRRNQIARVSERKLSRTRSWLLTAGIVALAVAAGGIGGAFGGEERISDGSSQ